MKRFFGILVIICLMFSTLPANAQRRGVLTNLYASWISATNTLSTVTFPDTSRDIFVRNGDESQGICVSPNGSTITFNVEATRCETAGGGFVTQLDPNSELYLTDFRSNTLTVLITDNNIGITASPVSVVVTY